MKASHNHGNSLLNRKLFPVLCLRGDVHHDAHHDGIIGIFDATCVLLLFVSGGYSLFFFC